MTKKIELGQFFTRKDIWLKPHIQQFIASINFNKIIDPFAGGGHLLKVFDNVFPTDGYDIDTTLSWPVNDSLKGIPLHPNDLCITNPPYLNKGTAKRFNRSTIIHYFTLFPNFDDLYLMGLEQCFKSFSYGIAIIPETYLLHSKKSKRIISATVLEENPFDDTDFPVVIITWGPEERDNYDIYKNEKYLGTNNDLMTTIIKSTGLKKDMIDFNNTNGNLGIVCIDRPDGTGGIQFVAPSKIKGPIKGSSRTSTIVMVNTVIDINLLIDKCNDILKKYRKDTSDIFMAPFKGNDRNGIRRRRLDFTMARTIIENALASLGHTMPIKNKKDENLLSVELFEIA